MSTICPHCRTYRPHDADTPAWQCPACHKAYAKAGEGGSGAPARVAPVRYERDGVLSGVPWPKLLLAAAVLVGAWWGWQKSQTAPVQTRVAQSREGKLRSGEVSTVQLQQLAAASAAGDVLMFSASWCPNCSSARSWMDQYGFKYEVCDIETSPACKSQLFSLDAQGGIPYLIVKGKHMSDGFDSQEFINILKR